jgi:hypothetical protein
MLRRLRELPHPARAPGGMQPRTGFRLHAAMHIPHRDLRLILAWFPRDQPPCRPRDRACIEAARPGENRRGGQPSAASPRASTSMHRGSQSVQEGPVHTRCWRVSIAEDAARPRGTGTVAYSTCAPSALAMLCGQCPSAGGTIRRGAVQVVHPVWSKYSNLRSHWKLRLYRRPRFGLSPAPLLSILRVTMDGKG